MFSVYLYSIRAVAQDDFADLQAPTEEQRRNTVSIEEERRNREYLKSQQLDIAAPPPSSPFAASPLTPPPSSSSVDSTTQGQVQHTGILGRLRGTFGGKGTESQLVYGAPNVDRVGRIGGVDESQIHRRIV
jgi:cytochrome c oxidase assembly factor 3